MDKKMNAKQIIEAEHRVHLQTYARSEVVFSHGKGVYLYDVAGKAYLDFVAGIAVNALGHCDPQLQQALTEQAARLWHCSNLYYSEPQVRLAQLLVDHSFADKVFFCNSGTEAIEGAIKIARKWATVNRGKDSHEIIAFNRSFHGRTMGALSATGQPKYWEGFEPMLPGFQFATFNDLNDVESRIGPKTAAIMVEPVQGEGGIHPAEPEFLQGLKELCRKQQCLLVLDEIQCGLGRTGKFFAYEHYGIEPDILALAKPLAGGLPMGAILMTDAVASAIKTGDHGSTFGGGPLVAHVAAHTVSRILGHGLLQQVAHNGRYLISQLAERLSPFEEVTAIRGLGLMIGIDFKLDVKQVIATCLNNGLIVARAGESTLRLTPPLIIERNHIDEAIDKLVQSIQIVRGKNGSKSKN
ncbi:MAG: aspartate aminotransferase family protein [candidate division KSB1 bacterium]|nr:aspartate aminotransferase family protein [candidate division KSB1 bacterium]MDZ7333940.1 aspartate aminotransferase family protein [candidate division KSB1 bacterium]MDZ7358521.1 aspartate aminotransferase family protein [candidate division KSB1 bacterium]MDZ7375167.1 aspartate aminotransferase family protein [candidate division KSB1 bacterium]MDZ7399186.1 aspartate aminotransferase family protein [candidate division KSB1 bacterium]